MSGAALRYGLYMPNFGIFSNARVIIELATAAESSGWDGLFLWDHMLFERDATYAVGDPWVLLTAAASVTERIRLGTTITPIARRRPWVLARQTVTLDHFSRGRVVLGVGLGDPPEADFAPFGEVADARERSLRLDEGLDVLTGLWSAEPFRYDGAVYRIDEVTFQPPPVQQPRIPIWVGGLWPHKAPFRRAARWDGVFPISTEGPMSGAQLRRIVTTVRSHRTAPEPFDVVVHGTTGDDDAADRHHVNELRDAGMTWWLEYLDSWRGSLPDLHRRVRVGPPGL